MPKRVRKIVCYCYILECADGSFYTGWTVDPERRLREHNAGRGSRYTRSRRPVRLLLLEVEKDRISAMRRERAIKGWPRARKVRLIAESGAKVPSGKRQMRRKKAGMKRERRPLVRK